MSENIKNALGIVAIISMLALVFAAVGYVGVFSRSTSYSSSRNFSVTGEGKSVAVPDIATFTLSLNTQGGLDISKSQKDNSDKFNKVIDFLKSKGIDEKDITTQNYDVFPRYQYYNCPLSAVGEGAMPCPESKISGYDINQSVAVKVREFDDVGDILSGVVERGANSVSQLSFTQDDPTEAQNNAREKAIEIAKKKAKSIAKAGGFRLGELLSIEESNTGSSIYYTKGMEASIGIGGGSVPNIQPGSQEVTVNLTLKYEIE